MLTNFPASVTDLEKCRPVYEDMPGWQADTSGARRFEELPPNAQRYIRKLEETLACPVSMISVGMNREQTIIRQKLA